MRRKLSALYILLILVAGCSAHKEYVAADKGTYDCVAPEYSAYVEADPKLSAEEKTLRVNLVRSWFLRLEKNK